MRIFEAIFIDRELASILRHNCFCPNCGAPAELAIDKANYSQETGEIAKLYVYFRCSQVAHHWTINLCDEYGHNIEFVQAGTKLFSYLVDEIQRSGLDAAINVSKLLNLVHNK